MAYLLNGGTLERAQAIAAQESPRTWPATKWFVFIRATLYSSTLSFCAYRCVAKCSIEDV